MSRQDVPENQHKHIAGWMWFGFWGLLLVMLWMFFANYLESERNPNRHVVANQDGTIVLQRNRQGHYHSSGRINGVRVEFLVDTGATSVAIPSKVAKKIGLTRGQRIWVNTANGVAQGYATQLKSVAIGPLEVIDIDALINPNVDDEVVLLGMAYLKHFEFTQRGDQLIIRSMQVNH